MFKKIQLKNGLKVLLVQSKKSPVVSIQMWVKTGSADETKGLEGISHFIEHLVFKGTEKFKVGEIASKVEGAGGELNAYTSFDQTVFYVTISKEFQNTGLDVISQMMGFPTFDAQEIDNEREVVLEEIKRGYDNPHRQSSRLLFESIYKKHPYGKPVIGYEENIKTVSKNQILKYFQSRYVPENMTLLVVGDFEFNEMKTQVETYFNSFKKFKLKKIVRKKEPAQTKPRVVAKQAAFAETLMYLSWNTPPASHKDIAALDVLALILGQGDSSRLNFRLRLKNHLVNGVGASNFSPINSGFFGISTSLHHDKLSEVLSATTEVLTEFLSEGPSAEEMTKALINFNSDEYYSVETVDGMARKFGSFEHLFKDYRRHKTFLKQINSLKAADILRVAKKYLNLKSLNVCILSPQDQNISEKALQTFVKEFKAALIKKPKKLQKNSKQKKATRINWSPSISARAKKEENQLRRKVFPSKARLILRPNFDTPVVSLRCAFLGGLRFEPKDKTGLTELLSRVWPSGAGPWNEVAFNAKIESLASSLSTFGGRNTAGITATTLAPFSDQICELFEILLLDPHLPEEVIVRERAQMIEQLRTRKDHPTQIAILNFTKAMFGDHPYGTDAMGTEESLARITREDLLNHIKKMRTAGNLCMSAAGQVDPDKFEGWLTGILKKLPPGERPDIQQPLAKVTQSQRLFEESKKEQSHIVCGYPGLKLSDPNRYVLQVIQSILAGQGGRLFLELRDKASLAYSVSPLRMEGLEGGYFGAYIGCSPEKGEKAIKMMKEEFSKLVETQVGELELDRAKRYLIGRHDIELQRGSAISAAVLFDEIYGIDFQETFHFPERIRAVTAESVRNLAKQIFSQSEIVSVVGPAESWAKEFIRPNYSTNKSEISGAP